jgi:hypothetical protein
MTADFEVAAPGPGGGGWTNSDHVNHLAVFINSEDQEREGQYGKYQVAHCEFVLCLDDELAWTDTDVAGAALAPRILSADADIVAGRLYEGKAKGNKSAPVLISDPTPEERTQIKAVLADYATRHRSGRISFDVVGYNADHKPVEKPLDEPEA